MSDVPPASAPKKPVIVLGMHRSGTSAMARLVQELGLSLGTDLLPATDGNIYGHFEDTAFIHFHDALIARFFPQRAPFCEWLPLADAEIAYTDADRAEAKAIWNAHRASGSTAWKDPRTSLFLDLWLETIPDSKAIVCLRHPYQVHHSLLRRGEPFLHVEYGSAIAGWTIYNQRILRSLAGQPRDRFVVVDVEAAFRTPRELAEALARFLDLPFSSKADEAISTDAFHFGDYSAEALDDFETFLPVAGGTYWQLRQLDLLHPVEPCAPDGNVSPIRSEEARLIEFEETHGLRARAKKMLVRSIAVDRQRTSQFYQQLLKADTEKDRLIEDLSRLTEHLKAQIPMMGGQPK
jgi:hypothetical protein